MVFPDDYAERILGGVPGRMIGLYLGNPPERHTYHEMVTKFGELSHYVNDMIDWHLVALQDSLTYFFTFLRAHPDYGNQRDITALVSLLR